jgi:hypothetical protein
MLGPASRAGPANSAGHDPAAHHGTPISRSRRNTRYERARRRMWAGRRALSCGRTRWTLGLGRRNRSSSWQGRAPGTGPSKMFISNRRKLMAFIRLLSSTKWWAATSWCIRTINPDFERFMAKHIAKRCHRARRGAVMPNDSVCVQTGDSPLSAIRATHWSCVSSPR